MKRPLSRTRKALPVAVFITLVVALLPASWMRSRPVRSVVGVVKFPLQPLQDGAGWVAGWLRPRGSEVDPERGDASLEEVYQEMEKWRTLYQAAQLRIGELEDDLEQLRRVPLEPLEEFGVAVRPLNARVTARNPTALHRAVELNRGERVGVHPGTIAVYDGVHLVGRVSESSALRSELILITNPDIGLIRARVAIPDVNIAESPEILLEPVGDGTLVADADRDLPVEPGAQVLLSDGGWPQTAQAMILGTVESVTPKDEQPLRNLIVVRPKHELYRLSSVTLVLEVPDRQAVAEGGEATP